MSKAKREQIFQTLANDEPEPTTELEYQSDFELLIAVTLSAQATDVSMSKATRELFPVANTPAAIASLSEARPTG